ncbi:MAG: hypothetical protein ABIQ16_14240 [Polyangiaceae bacterium]
MATSLSHFARQMGMIPGGLDPGGGSGELAGGLLTVLGGGASAVVSAFVGVGSLANGAVGASLAGVGGAPAHAANQTATAVNPKPIPHA